MTQDQFDRTPDDVVVWFESVKGDLHAYAKELRRRIQAHDERFED